MIPLTACRGDVRFVGKTRSSVMDGDSVRATMTIARAAGYARNLSAVWEDLHGLA